jgi:hypothetical protein
VIGRSLAHYEIRSPLGQGGSFDEDAGQKLEGVDEEIVVLKPT